MSLVRLASALLAATLALACGGDEKTVEIDGAAFTVEREGEGFRISGEEEGVGAFSGEFGENARIPDGFPEDVPVYSDARVVGGMVAGEGAMLTLQTDDDPDQVAEFYRERLVKEGWSLGPPMDVMGRRLLSFEKGDRSGAVQISPEAGDTTILITIGMGG
jgi:hypothetical protein